MKLGRPVLFSVLFVLMLGGCQAHARNDDDNVETWAKRPFCGQLRLLILREDTGALIPGATLRVSDLPIVGLQDQDSSPEQAR